MKTEDRRVHQIEIAALAIVAVLGVVWAATSAGSPGSMGIGVAVAIPAAIAFVREIRRGRRPLEPP